MTSNLCGLGLALAFAFALPSGASAAQATQTSAPAIARPAASPNKVLMAHCCHAHPLPPYDAYCCHAAVVPVVPVAPVYGYGYAAGGYYGPAGVVGQTRRVARRTARRVGRRH